LSRFGKEIYRAWDELGPILVFEAGVRRTLSFTGDDEQSAMSLAAPARLEYVYTQAMMLGALLTQQVRSVLILGLGGGSLARAVLQYLPACRVAAVEARPLVVEIAQRLFALPTDQRLEVHVGDAVDFMKKEAGPYDLIFTDLYGPSGMDPQQITDGFLGAGKLALRDSGVMVVNLWNTDYRTSRKSRSALVHAFDGRLLQMAVQGGNSIAFGFAGPIPGVAPRELFARAQELGHRMGIPLQRLARGLWSQNLPHLAQGQASSLQWPGADLG